MSSPGRAPTLAAFRVRSFRFQWPADLLTSWAFEMETLILGWYVMVGTGSVLLLTLFAALQSLGTLAAPIYGVLADRVGSRDVLCAMRTVYALLAALLAALGLLDLLTPAIVLVIAAVAGLVRPNDLVLRNALIGDTIPPEHLVGALGLSRSTSDSARIAGALVGATLSAVLGLGPAYVAVTACYLASLTLTLRVARPRPVVAPGGRGEDRQPGAPALHVPRPSHWGDLIEGLAYVWATPRVLAAVWLAVLVNLTAYPLTNGLLPYVVRHVYRIDARGLGWLVASFSGGALLGSLAMVVTGGPRRPARMMVVGIAIWYLVVLGFGQVATVTPAALLLVVAGCAQSVAMIAMAATLLHAAGSRFRARVLGVRTLAVYALPLGLLASGPLVERAGFPATATAYCLVGLACTVLVALRWRASVWRA